MVSIYNCISVSTGICEEIEEENQEPEACEDNFYLVKDNGKNKKLRVCYQSNGSQNGNVFVYLEEGKKRRSVLSSQGRTAIFSKGNKIYPDISVPWHISAEENASSDYVWNGHSYEYRDLKKTISLSAKALLLFKESKTDEAITMWEEAIALNTGGLSAESYNNLGYAYYKKAKARKNDEYYEKAEEYLKYAIQMQPKRWVAYLNLADIYLEQGDFSSAIKHYNKLLELKPDYKNASLIRKKVSKLNLEHGAVSTSTVILDDSITQTDTANNFPTGILFQSFPPLTLPNSDELSKILANEDYEDNGPVNGYKLDLNGDGIDDFLIQSPMSLCGTGGCGLIIIDGKSFRKIGDFFGGSIIILDKKVDGYAMIQMLKYTDSDSAEIVSYIYRGAEYKSTTKSIYSGKTLDKLLGKLRSVVKKVRKIE